MSLNISRVFISSTFADLAAYRQAAVDAIREMGLEPILWEAPTPTRDPLEKIENFVKTSDIFILILGYRYGSVIPDIGESGIELEYDVANEMRKPVLAFLLSEDAPVPPSAIDVDRSRIESFRQRILSQHLVSKFSSPSELAAKIVQSLSLLITRQQDLSQRKLVKTKKVHNVRVIRLLLSSPGDVTEERDRVSRAVFRFNQESVEERGLFIKLIRWEDMAPQIGPGGQNVINKQIGEYDLFIGIMWNRFGTRTDVAASGTKEEFDAAVHLWKENEKPWITFYFCDRPANFTTPEQLEQKRLVLEFHSELQTLGVVRSFISAGEFEELVLKDLARITSSAEFKRLFEE
jgi:hypothetical protein